MKVTFIPLPFNTDASLIELNLCTVYAGMAWNVTGPQPTVAPAVQGKFNKGVFTPYASVATESPALIMGAISKRWLAPGWRLGWVIVHDPVKVLEEVSFE